MKGRFLVDVVDKETAKPVVGANINIFSDDGNKKIIENLKTNISGQTDEVQLDAPDFEYSQKPNQPQPYSEYTVEVTFPGYKYFIVKGVQIFPDILAIQPVELVPSSRTLLTRQNEIIVIIPPNTLMGTFPPKIPEDPIKKEPPPTGFVVLDYPQVPEFIIVHDGLPDDTSAPNYWVPFKSYIKNVASSEIFSTWPTSTIQANVCCIVSFTLNRVFTEWYRGKGKNFTITSSTAFDHKYVHNRNIFDNISVIVDKFFNLFVKRPEFRQPLLTQYCDGVRVKCPDWLTQWGSKELGDKGQSFDQILKYFYGYNLDFERAKVVTGVPQSFPGYILELGSSGSAVSTIQKFLNRISQNYPAVPKVKADGYYGKDTEKSVKKFQEIFKLPVNGIVDFSTWYKISDIYVAVTKIAELNQ